jgi:hypothetical protein
MEAFIERLPSCPEGFAGAGVVIAAGGLAYLVNAWVVVKLLRQRGCGLPIEVWHLGPEEMPEPLARLFRTSGVACVDAHERFAKQPVRQVRGWALKPYAALASRFRHVLLLDADNVPTLDPSFLLETPQYREHGALFWPDRGDGVGIEGGLLRANHPIWPLTGLAFWGDPSFESGQVCVDKVRCWRELRLALWMNEHADFWYRFLYGDKDTFQIAWRKLGTPWAMPSTNPSPGDERVFWQVDFDGRVLFQHRHGDKWRLDGGNPAIPGFVDEDVCRAAIDELRRPLFDELGVGDAEVHPPVAPGSWLWTRVGRRPRVVRFAPGGFVDAGQEKAARLWRARAGELEVLGDDLAVSGRFRFAPHARRWLGLGADGAMLVRTGGPPSG